LGPPHANRTTDRTRRAHAGPARQVITDCLACLGLDVSIIDRVGRYPSPTVLVNGVDVMRPEGAAAVGDACRLDLPTARRILDVLRADTPGHVQTAPPPTEF